jgi:quercetin dioxygenase-like cupin family protein
MQPLSAEVCLPTADLSRDLAFFVERLGFRLDTIFPADDPRVAVLIGHGVRLRLDRDSAVAPGALRLACADPDGFADGARELVAPNGVRIQIVEAAPRSETPKTQHGFVVCRLNEGDPWITGRAGMQYRDLILGRLGGAVIASHIRIRDAGPVQDLVHFHDVAFQLIYCLKGWVKVVYEDQGPPFVLRAGDCVIQPPKIRHRVLESSGNLEVIEVSAPAEHLTTMDHEMELPTPREDRGRVFGGQKFCRSEAQRAVWTPWRISGFEARDTGIAEATAGVASVRVARPVGRPDPIFTSHTADILFAFVLKGSVTLRSEGRGDHALGAGHAFVIPPGRNTALTECSKDLELLEVSLPAQFETSLKPRVT